MANRKRNINFARPEEPAFIKRLKAQYGYKEGPDIDTKKEELPDVEQADLRDKDDEQPQIVVLKKGDLSEDEVKKLKEKEKEEESLESSKIIFRKPNKDKLDEKKNENVQSSYKGENDKNKKSSDERQKNDSRKSVNNSRLLSFDQEDDEDE